MQVGRLGQIVAGNLPGISLQPIGHEPQVGKPQILLVRIAPGGHLPLHRHTCAATMTITEGGGTLLSSDPETNGRVVETGICIHCEPGDLHGFKAGSSGLAFISQNDGIVGHEPWDFQAA
jgi:quercetin dioxygenase-like cupin family protein